MVDFRSSGDGAENRSATPLGLSQGFNGLCATRDSTPEVAQKPPSPRGKPVGGEGNANRTLLRHFMFAGGILVVCAANAVVGDDRFWIATDTTPSLPNSTRIEQALHSETEVSFADNSLEEALNYLKELHHIEIWLDKASLQEEGLTPDQQVTLVMSGISLESALHLLLHPLGLTHVNENEVLKITTQSKANEMLSTRVYPVRDLVDMGDGTDDYSSLMTALQVSTSGKWMEVDQEGGAMSPVESARSLVIRQTQKVHREIEGILSALRRSKQLQGLGSIAISPDVPEVTKPIEPSRTQTTMRTPISMRTPAATQTWQRPRVHSAE